MQADEAPRRELIYGAELMTHGEREQYRKRLRGAAQASEKARVEEQHRRRMRERARARGVEIGAQGVVEKK